MPAASRPVPRLLRLWQQLPPEVRARFAARLPDYPHLNTDRDSRRGAA